MYVNISFSRLVSQFVLEARIPCWRNITGRETLAGGERVKMITLENGNRIDKGHWLNDYWLEEKEGHIQDCLLIVLNTVEQDTIKTVC